MEILVQHAKEKHGQGAAASPYGAMYIEHGIAHGPASTRSPVG